MIEASLSYLRNGDDALVTTLIGGVLLLASPLLIPAFAVLGYVVRVLRRTAAGDDEPPAFDAWGDLLVDGLKAFAVTFAYSLLPLAVLVAAAVVGVGSAVAGGGDGGLLGGLAALSVALVALAASLAGLYVTPAAIAAVADSGRVRDGFAARALWAVVAGRTYARGWLAAAVVVLAGVLVTGLLSIVPILGTVAGFVVQFYALVAAAAIVGRTLADVRLVATGAGRPEPAERPAA